MLRLGDIIECSGKQCVVFRKYLHAITGKLEANVCPIGPGTKPFFLMWVWCAGKHDVLANDLWLAGIIWTLYAADRASSARRAKLRRNKALYSRLEREAERWSRTLTRVGFGRVNQ